MGYIDELISHCLIAKQASPTRELDVTDLSNLDGIRKAIYVIEEVGGDPVLTFDAMATYKKRKERACPKLNAPSRILYVGSSTQGARKRIEEHIGLGHAQTYALHLRYWFTGEYKISIRQYDVPDAVLQILEDDLSSQLKPAFGKRGGNI